MNRARIIEALRDAATFVEDNSAAGAQHEFAGTLRSLADSLDAEFAHIAWRARDLGEFRPQWNEERREEWLCENSKYIQEGTIQHGFLVIRDLLDNEDD